MPFGWGEPLLRRNLIEKLKNLFSLNQVITNGTIPLPLWKDVRFLCSVDGTKDYHEAQRGKNTYDKIKANINRKDLDVHLFCVVTKINEKCLEEFVEEWSKTSVKSVGFGFYTPIKGKNNEELWLNFKQRDKVIKRIKILKQKYPQFIHSSDAILDSFMSDKCQQTTEKCRRDYSSFNAMCFDSTMNRKFPCVIWEEADCSKCGCVGSVMGESIRNGRRISILNTKIKDILSNNC
ncbi:MAG: hypothetical protein COY38_02660 [Candidatus Aenigmarchaeota archaeon CG_4_10_14_0_8_um_filter_37_24]|nr:MAG: hypothetical protein COY38_02660 [Candidatus Aenigmarchaeota archaeon CG_4_10_14_0_8_um_filter_37_24]PJB75450.1 MAG: hypothetical protein CO092_01855 [Candidatus Aenigmarchaeota archaeon CG_4_9_14_3_um_filter_37_18]